MSSSALSVKSGSSVVAIDRLQPNPWNPNKMDAFMFDKAVASIQQFGFVDPVTVRQVDDYYEIVDGEHRWKAAQSLGYNEIPVWDIGPVNDDVAKQLTIVLNETRGSADEAKLSDLLKDLLSDHTTEELVFALPFSPERFDELVGKPAFDWNELERHVDREDQRAQWVERTYRLPIEAAQVLDRALAKAKDGDDISDAQALELVAADFLGGA